MAPASSLPVPVTRDLESIVGPEHVLLADELRAGYEVDWTGRFRGRSLAVVRPASAEEVAAVVARCAVSGIPIVAQGGNTGLVGGGVPRNGEVVLSMRRLADVGRPDVGGRSIEADAGATLTAVSAAASAARLEVPIDLASRDGATIGGMIATDAGGIHSLAYGRMRDHVIGLDAVGADGGLMRDADAALIAGSEGTLAIITRARLRLIPRLTGRAVALVGLGSIDEALELVGHLRQTLPSLVAAELMLADGLDLVTDHLGVPPPFTRTPPSAVLLECRAATDPLEALAAALEGAPEAAEILVGTDAPDRRRLWTLREAHPEAIAMLGVPHKMDVTVPDTVLATFLERLPSTASAASPGARVILFGHVGVADYHVNVVGPPLDDEAADEAVLRLVAELGGDVAGEHGAGIAKARWLALTRSEGELRAIAARKASFDPKGLLNPGVIPAARIAPLLSGG